MKQEWLPIKGYEGLYEINNFGVVRTVKSGHIKAECFNGKYYVVNLVSHGKQRTKYIHRLMYDTFYGIPKGEYVVHHKDEDKLNNSLDNLELMTLSDHSSQHASEQKGCVRKDSITVNVFDIDTLEFICSYPSLSTAAEALHRDPNSVKTAVVNDGTSAGYYLSKDKEIAREKLLVFNNEDQLVFMGITLQDVADYLECTREAVRVAIKDQRFVKKHTVIRKKMTCDDIKELIFIEEN